MCAIVTTFEFEYESARPRSCVLRGGWLAATCCSLLLAAGCDFPGKPNPADQPTPPEKVLKFGALFAENCAGCHGATGDYGPAPPLNSPLFRAIVSQADLESVIRDGRKGTPMPAFAKESGGRLSDAQIQVLAYEIKGVRYKLDENAASGATNVEPDSNPSSAAAIVPAWGVAGSPPDDAPAYALPETQPPRTSEEYETIRKTTFTQACAGCHGDRGQGAEKAGAIDEPALLALASDQFLRRLVITGRADLGMPEFSGTAGRSANFHPLSGKEIAELVDLLGHWRGEGAAPGGDHQPSKTADSVRDRSAKADQHGKS